eukprot:3761391-Pleurochrysis_carterae.AAC.1
MAAKGDKNPKDFILFRKVSTSPPSARTSPLRARACVHACVRQRGLNDGVIGGFSETWETWELRTTKRGVKQMWEGTRGRKARRKRRSRQ